MEYSTFLLIIPLFSSCLHHYLNLPTHLYTLNYTCVHHYLVAEYIISFQLITLPPTILLLTYTQIKYIGCNTYFHMITLITFQLITLLPTCWCTINWCTIIFQLITSLPSIWLHYITSYQMYSFSPPNAIVFHVQSQDVSVLFCFTKCGACVTGLPFLVCLVSLFIQPFFFLPPLSIPLTFVSMFSVRVWMTVFSLMHQ